MQITFTDTAPSNVRLNASIVNQGDMLEGLDAALADAAPAVRFKGSAGQVFEGFVSEGGSLKRVAIAGAGETDADKRKALYKEFQAIVADELPVYWLNTLPYHTVYSDKVGNPVKGIWASSSPMDRVYLKK